MTRICLLALIGLPGAGKTRLSDWLLQDQISLSGWNILHLCYDDYFDVKFINDNNYREQRQFIHNVLSQLIKTLQDKAADSMQLPEKIRRAPSAPESDNYLIVCDDNHYYRSMRYKLFQLCRSQGCSYAQVFVASTLSECLRGNQSRGASGVPEAVIHQMEARLEPPGVDIWERNSLKLIHTDDAKESEIIREFIQSLHNLDVETPPTVHVKEPQLQSLTHQLDLQLRARIQAQMQETKSSASRPEMSRIMNEQRKQILIQFRLDMSSRQTDLNDDVNLEPYVKLLN